MIAPVVRSGFLNMKRDRSALLLTFVLPIVFFSIFAAVFGGRKGGGMPAVRVAIVDQDHSEASRRLVAALRREPSLKVETERQTNDKTSVPYDRQSAESAVREGDIPSALIIPKGFGDNPIAFGPSASREKILILHDSSDPIAAQVVGGMLQKAGMTGMPDIIASSGSKYFDKFAGGLTPEQHRAMDKGLAELRQYEKKRDAEQASGKVSTQSQKSDDDSALIAYETRDVVGSNKPNPTISFYAAGIGVMFLLFTASAAGGTILDQVEDGTLDRILSTRATMGWLLAGKLVWLSMIGLSQLIVMFVWAALVFKVQLFTHLPGFFAMAIPTAVAAAALGLVMASACRTRAQLGAISTLIILVMSALGGSMFPRFLMPEFMQKVGLITFNAWALDGFVKVFWRDEPVSHLWPQLLVLITAATVFFMAARFLARKWEYS